MDGSHAKHTFPSQFKGTNLNNDRQRFEHKNAAHNKQYDFVTRHNRHNAERGAEC